MPICQWVESIRIEQLLIRFAQGLNPKPAFPAAEVSGMVGFGMSPATQPGGNEGEQAEAGRRGGGFGHDGIDLKHLEGVGLVVV